MDDRDAIGFLVFVAVLAITFIAGKTSNRRKCLPGCFAQSFLGGRHHQVRGINVVRLPSPVDPPAASQDQGLDEIAIFTGSLQAGRRFDHASRDAWKAQPIPFSDF